MMVRYVTPTGRLGRILADAAIRIVRINENNDRTLIRVGALLISLSRHEIVCLLAVAKRPSREALSGVTYTGHDPFTVARQPSANQIAAERRPGDAAEAADAERPPQHALAGSGLRNSER
jgi:hypothetical protein